MPLKNYICHVLLYKMKFKKTDHLGMRLKVIAKYIHI